MASQRTGPFLLGQIPDKPLYEIARQIVHRLAVGHADITGDDFGTIFANAVGGEHRGKPIGIADVSVNGCAWSVKTVKSEDPFGQKVVRLISGRNSPDYSLGITDPHKDPEATGRAVLAIWNKRVNQALDEFNDLRIAVMLRDMTTRNFSLFEEEAERFIPTEYEWTFNKRGNLDGLAKLDGTHMFTWQPHGSQFTIIRKVPASARKFSIVPNVPTVTLDTVLAAIKFKPEWVTIH